MTPQDVPAVAALERRAYPFPWSEGIFRDCLRVGYLCRVADLEGRIAAYGIVAMGVGESHILNLCVDETLRGRGIGRQMLALLLERSRDAGMANTCSTRKNFWSSKCCDRYAMAGCLGTSLSSGFAISLPSK